MPTTVTEVQSFPDLARYYKKFIEIFLKIATLLTQLTKKDTKFEWNDKCKQSF